MSSASLLTSLLQYKAWANQELFAELQRLDPITQHSELHAALRILNHIHVVERIFVANLQGIRHDYSATNTPETPTLTELQQAVQETDRWYLDYVAELSAEQLAERLHFNFVDGDAGCMSRAEMLAHIVTHGGYHRGAVGRIMAQLQLAPPRDIYTRFLHEDQPQRREAS
ncbi:MAG: DinB family protein [Pseudomonas sp.]|uniref:DinB family protein n=1 Tax=Pseudomonas sp. TaxID=306 RepID=UPI00271C380E|nr:DinB family protein [Pseudomonas sp.]MDO9620238.1 DinB family protein [Pseudomonas sp.]MDP2445118.1 DinB family protein [Pseudomonas sp.]MDZ4338151.1 DinB family protein [Pseudomonas sp.]